MLKSTNLYNVWALQSSGSNVSLTQTLTSIIHIIKTEQVSHGNSSRKQFLVSPDCPSLSDSAALTGSKQDWIQDPSFLWWWRPDPGRWMESKSTSPEQAIPVSVLLSPQLKGFLLNLSLSIRKELSFTIFDTKWHDRLKRRNCFCVSIVDLHSEVICSLWSCSACVLHHLCNLWLKNKI